MKKVVDSERSARTDLEMYVAVLNTQKGVLQEDTDKLKRELHNGMVLKIHVVFFSFIIL